MKVGVALGVLIAVTICPQPSCAQRTPGAATNGKPVSVHGVMDANCAEYVESAHEEHQAYLRAGLKRRIDSSYITPKYAAFMGAMHGYLTALSIEGYKTQIKSSRERMLSLEKYCLLNPENPFVAAVVDLVTREGIN